MYLRLDKLLSLKGWGSRKIVNQLIKKGRVKVNFQVVKDPSFKVNLEKDLVEIDNQKISLKVKFYYKMYKPKGFVTSTKDLQNPTIMKLIPKNLPGYKELFPVGRLDKDAEGLLLLTNDGILAHRILHPKWKVSKIYEVKLFEPLKEEDKVQIEKGVNLTDGPTLPTKIYYLNSEKNHLKIEVYEGRYHLIKRIFGKFGYKILNLKRISIGNIVLGELKEGEIKALSEKEESNLKNFLSLKENLK